MAKKAISTKALLKKLEEYGDCVLNDGDDERQQDKTRFKQNKDRLHQISTTAENDTETKKELSTRKKKKRKKSLKHLSMTSQNSNTSPNLNESEDNDASLIGHKKFKSKKFKLIHEALGLSDLSCASKQDSETASNTGRKRKREPEVVVFEAYKKKQKQSPQLEAKHQENGVEFDIKQAKHEIRRFGIKGFQAEEKSEAVTSLLISLGAKPPKKKYVNYKQFQEIRKKEIEEENKKREVDRKFGLKVGKKKERVHSRGSVDGQIGFYKAGAQFVRKDDVK